MATLTELRRASTLAYRIVGTTARYTLADLIGDSAAARHVHPNDERIIRRRECLAALRFGQLDLLVNNAGFNLSVGGAEESSIEQAKSLFDTNFFGMVRMTQAVIPQMRARGAGMIVNITSSATLASFPYAAAYTGSKTAVQGFTNSLAHELEPLGIAVKLVEPGYGPTTAFTANTDVRLEDVLPEPYASHAAPISPHTAPDAPPEVTNTPPSENHRYQIGRAHV